MSKGRKAEETTSPRGIETTIGYTVRRDSDGFGGRGGYDERRGDVLLYVTARFDNLSADGPAVDFRGASIDQLADALRESEAAAVAGLREKVEAMAARARADIDRLAAWLDGDK